MTGVVDPGQARLDGLVERLVGEYGRTGQARWRGDLLLDHVEDATLALRRKISDLRRVHLLLFEADRGIGAILLRGDLDVATPVVAAHIAGDMVPQHFNAILRNRERVIAAFLKVAHAIPAIDGLYIQRAVAGCLHHRGRYGCRAMGGIDRHAISGRVTFEQGHLALGELVPILIGVAGGDDEQGLFSSKGVGQESVRRDVAGIFGQPPGPGGNTAIGVTFFLRAQRCQGRAEPGRFVSGDSGHCMAGQQAQRQDAAFVEDGFHECVPEDA
ncbi:hypothetical protein D3C77_368870 [compost metagenome]